MMMSAKNNHGRRLARGVVSMGKNKVQQKREDELARAQEDLQRREANRIHCKETRDRKRERERLLREEVEVLKLYKTIVEDGPDLFSLHNPVLDAPFSFLCDNFFQRLQVAPEDVLGRPLATIVDPRDIYVLRTALVQELNHGHGHGHGRYSDGGRGAGQGPRGSLIHLRVVCSGGASCEASMTIIRGSQGLIVVTRLYDA